MDFFVRISCAGGEIWYTNMINMEDSAPASHRGGEVPLDRKTVLLDEAQLERQREYTRQLAALHQQRGKPVYALVDTFGCQQNVADSQHILGMLRDMGCQFTDDAAQADIVVLNTCAIRDHAEKRVYGNLGALTHTKKQNPEQVICLCGCMAQRPEVAEKVRQSYRHVDLVFGPQALWKFPELLYRVYTRRGRVFSVEDEHGTIAEGMPVVREGNVRAWVSIMYGCNNFCSYCIVPTSGAGSAAGSLSASSMTCGSWPPRGIRRSLCWGRTSTPTARIWRRRGTLPTSCGSWTRSRGLSDPVHVLPAQGRHPQAV